MLPGLRQFASVSQFLCERDVRVDVAGITAECILIRSNRTRGIPAAGWHAMSLVIYGDPHGELRPLLEAVAVDRPAAIVILGDCDFVSPLQVELAPVFAAGVEVAYLYGNHEKDLPEFWNNLVGDHPGGLLHARIRRLGPYDVAGIAGVFKQRIWLPPAVPLFETRATLLRRLAHYERWRGGLPLRQRDAIFPEDFKVLVGKRADILVVHEAPSTHRHGFEVLDDLARALRVRLVVHGHHHTSLTGATPDGIAVIGLGKAEVLRLRAGDLP